MSNIVVLTTLPYGELLLDRVYKLYPSSSILETADMTTDNINKRVSSRPLYSEKFWLLIECTHKMQTLKDMLPALQTEWVNAIFLCPYKAVYTRVQDFLGENAMEFSAFNCYKVSFQFKVAYVKRRYAQISNGDVLEHAIAVFVAKRITGYESKLDSILLSARHGTGVSKAAIARLMPKKSYISLDGLWLTLLSGKLTYDSASSIKRLLVQYRFYPRPLLDSFEKFLNQFDSVYEKFILGEFNDETISMFITREGKSLGISSEFTAKRWLSLLSSLSYELVTLLRNQFYKSYAISAYSGYAKLVWIAVTLGRLEAFQDESDGNLGSGKPNE